MPEKPDKVERLANLRLHFSEYVAVESPFGEEQLRNHLRTLELRRGFSTVDSAARDAGFADSLRETLASWKIGVRGSQLVSPTKFRDELRLVGYALAQLEPIRIEDPTMDAIRVARWIWHAISGLEIVMTKDRDLVQNKVVSGTKTLHHLLPDLVFPIDRKYTATFFSWPGFQNHGERCFAEAFVEMASIAADVNPGQYVGAGWNSCTSKVLDNAVVGYCRKNNLQSPPEIQRQNNRTLIEAAKDYLRQHGQQ